MIAEDINSKESESGVIATLIHHPEYILHSEELLPNHFTVTSNQCVYTAIMKLVHDGIYTVDAYNIIEILNSMDATRKFADELTIDNLNELIEMSDILCRRSIAEYKILVSNVLDAAFRRETYCGLRECEKLCLTDSNEDVQREIYRVIDDIMTSYSVRNDIPFYSEVVDGLWDEIKNRQGTGYAGIPFKFPALNDYVTLERGELVIFGAQQKIGKSIMLLNCAVDLLRQDYSVLYIDSELSSRLFTARLLSHLSGIKYADLTSGNYSESDEQRIITSKEWVKTRRFTHVYLPYFDSESIYTTVKKIHNIQPIDVLIIDYFKSTGDDMDAFATYASMGRCVDICKNEIAGALNIAALGAAQATATNRLADSAKIARNASTIIMLMDKTDEEIQEDGGIDGGNRKMIVTTNRNGMQHSSGEWINLNFDGNHILYEQAKVQHVPNLPY